MLIAQNRDLLFSANIHDDQDSDVSRALMRDLDTGRVNVRPPDSPQRECRLQRLQAASGGIGRSLQAQRLPG